MNQFHFLGGLKTTQVTICMWSAILHEEGSFLLFCFVLCSASILVSWGKTEKEQRKRNHSDSTAGDNNTLAHTYVTQVFGRHWPQKKKRASLSFPFLSLFLFFPFSCDIPFASISPLPSVACSPSSLPSFVVLN